ncbi:MAG: hypothetical protein IPL52_18040 [Flavobacteriales bacterium]|nr:hypothetical protein [Flavobacteriales bacterium]
MTALACAPDGAVWTGSGNGAVSVWQRNPCTNCGATERSCRSRLRQHSARHVVGHAGDGVLFSNDGGARCVARNAGLPTLAIHALVAQVKGH